MDQPSDILSILLVEDNPGDARLIQEMLRDAHQNQLVAAYNLEVMTTLAQGLRHLENNRCNVILLDLTLPDSQGLQTFRSVLAQVQGVPILVLTGYGDHATALAAIQAGAQDYLVKDKINSDSLGRAIRYGIKRQELLHDLRGKHAELQASEERRHAMLDNSADGIVMVNEEKIICYANVMAHRLLAISEESLVGQSWPYESAPGMIREIEVKTTQGEISMLEMRVDETEWQKERVVMIHLRDVTRQKMAEIARRESDERLRSTIDSMDDLVFILDRDGRFLSYAPPSQQAKMRGVPKFIIGRLYHAILPGVVSEKLTAAIAEVKDSAWVQQFEYALKIPNQQYWFSAKVSARHDAEDQYNGATVVIRDITQLKEAEENYRRKNDQLEHLRVLSLELTLDLSLNELLRIVSYRAVEIMEARGSAVYLLDDATQKLVEQQTAGYPMILEQKQFARGEDLPGRIWQVNQIVHIGEYESIHTRDRQAPTTGKIEVIGAPIRWQHEFLGILIVYSNYGQYFRNQDVQLLNLFVAQVAIALQNTRMHMQLQAYNEELSKRVEQRTQELREAYEQLRSLDKLKSKFLSDVSHELRTPTTNLKLYLTLLQKGATHKAEKYMRVLEEETHRLELLIESILHLSQLDMDAGQAELSQVVLQKVLQKSLQAVRSLADEKQLYVRLNLPEPPVFVVGSSDQLLKAILHVLRNGVMYTRSGGITVTLRVVEQMAELVVADTGIGIGPDELKHIFDRFYRGDRVSQSTLSGIGLGLPITRAILEMHGGAIEIASAVDQGTQVMLKIPLAVTPKNGVTAA